MAFQIPAWVLQWVTQQGREGQSPDQLRLEVGAKRAPYTFSTVSFLPYLTKLNPINFVGFMRL